MPRPTPEPQLTPEEEEKYLNPHASQDLQEAQRKLARYIVSHLGKENVDFSGWVRAPRKPDVMTIALPGQFERHRRKDFINIWAGAIAARFGFLYGGKQFCEIDTCYLPAKQVTSVAEYEIALPKARGVVRGRAGQIIRRVICMEADIRVDEDLDFPLPLDGVDELYIMRQVKECRPTESPSWAFDGPTLVRHRFEYTADGVLYGAVVPENNGLKQYGPDSSDADKARAITAAVDSMQYTVPYITVNGK